MKSIQKMSVAVLAILLSFSYGFSQTENPPQNWYHLDPSDGYNGVSAKKVYETILKDKVGKPVIVAIIDSGIDIQHEDLKDNLWVNPGEIPNDGKDNDNNGYVDDIHGWNFIGGPDGSNVGQDSYEATRVYAKLKYKYENASPEKLSKKEQEEYKIYEEVANNVKTERTKAEEIIGKINMMESMILNGLDKISTQMKAKSWTIDQLDSIDVSQGQDIAIGKQVITQIRMENSELNNVDSIKNTVARELKGEREHYQNKLDYAYNPDFDPRKTIVRDDYANSNQRNYGNNDVEGPDPLHGTHVAGIVGAVSNNGLGNDGIARNVYLMSVRAVPDGDERDKDVANAIRYAADNGASVINMSFGKGYSWDKEAVNDAVKYAESKDVLLVHAAGNSGQDNDMTNNFPNDNLGMKRFLFFKKQQVAKNWIEVGALSFEKDDKLAASFSNYGTANVDIFAPGVQIYNTVPNNNYENLQGTSMASPVVAGVAAVIRSQYPALTAEQVKEALMKSTSKIETSVIKPGSKTGEKVSFSKLSVTGGVVNLEKALNYASKMKGQKKIVKSGV